MSCAVAGYLWRSRLRFTCKKLRGVSKLHRQDGWDGSSSPTTEMSSEHSMSFRALLSVWGDHRFVLKCSPVFLSAWHTPFFVCPFFREKNFNGFQVERKRQQSRWTRFLRWTGTYSRPMTGCCASNRWGEKNRSDTVTVCLSVCSLFQTWLISGCWIWLVSELCCPPRVFSKHLLSSDHFLCAQTDTLQLTALPFKRFILRNEYYRIDAIYPKWK